MTLSNGSAVPPLTFKLPLMLFENCRPASLSFSGSEEILELAMFFLVPDKDPELQISLPSPSILGDGREDEEDGCPPFGMISVWSP